MSDSVEEFNKKLQPFIEAAQKASKLEKEFEKKHCRKMNEFEHDVNIKVHTLLLLLNLSIKK